MLKQVKMLIVLAFYICFYKIANNIDSSLLLIEYVRFINSK